MGNLSNGVFERRTPTGSKAFSVLICLDAAKFGLLSVFTLRDDFPESLGKTTAQGCKSPLPVDLRRSKTSCNIVIPYLNVCDLHNNSLP